MDKKIMWSYIAGYFDGEASLLLGVIHDKRGKSQGQTDGWNIQPNLCVTSNDYETLGIIKNFCESNGFKIYKLERKRKRGNQVKDGLRLSILGWENINKVIKLIEPYSTSKKPQYVLFHKLFYLITNRERNVHGQYIWTKELFMEAMFIVDEINSHKGHHRDNIYTANYFRHLWFTPIG